MQVVKHLFESLIQTWFSKNKSIVEGTFTRLASKPESKLGLNTKQTLKLKVSESNEFLYQVSDENTRHIVDLNMMTCTCCHFQVDGIPCQHGLAVIGEIGGQPDRYCSDFHTRESYMGSYAAYIVPLGDRVQWKVDKFRSGDKILPLGSKRPPGRSKKKMRRPRIEMLQTTRCGRCGSTRHNRRTCRQPRTIQDTYWNMM